MKTITMIKEGFTARQVYVLEQLTICNMTASQLSNDVLSKVSITAIIDDLKARGLVSRKRSKKDRRQVLLSITTRGREILNA